MTGPCPTRVADRAADRPVDVTVVVPTHNRPALLPRAVASALAQDGAVRVEVLVVDDGSTPPAAVPDDPRVRLLRLDPNRGGSAARNAGLAAAAGRWVTWLDDDDELLPGMLEACLTALSGSDLPAPVAAVAGLEVVDVRSGTIERRRPPSLPRGRCWNLEPAQPGRSFQVKQSLVIEREVMLALGGFDEAFRARVHSELFLRLNPACSILGVDRPGYRFYRHDEGSVTGDMTLRAATLEALIEKHRPVLSRRAGAVAALQLEFAATCRHYGRNREAWRWTLRAARHDPAAAARAAVGALRVRLSAAGGRAP